MPAAICLIEKDSINGKNVFLVKFYKSIRELADGAIPIDIYECDDVVANVDACKYIAGIGEEEEAHDGIR